MTLLLKLIILPSLSHSPGPLQDMNYRSLYNYSILLLSLFLPHPSLINLFFIFFGHLSVSHSLLLTWLPRSTFLALSLCFSSLIHSLCVNSSTLTILMFLIWNVYLAICVLFTPDYFYLSHTAILPFLFVLFTATLSLSNLWTPCWIIQVLYKYNNNLNQMFSVCMHISREYHPVLVVLCLAVNYCE